MIKKIKLDPKSYYESMYRFTGCYDEDRFDKKVGISRIEKYTFAVEDEKLWLEKKELWHLKEK